jgi:hypothetical protein
MGHGHQGPQDEPQSTASASTQLSRTSFHLLKRHRQCAMSWPRNTIRNPWSARIWASEDRCIVTGRYPFPFDVVTPLVSRLPLSGHRATPPPNASIVRTDQDAIDIGDHHLTVNRTQRVSTMMMVRI